MKLFEFHAYPGNETSYLKFLVLPSDELKKQLSEDWIKELQERVTDVFMEVIQENAENIDKKNTINFCTIQVKLNNDNDLETEVVPSELMEETVERIQDDVFEKINGDFLKSLSNLIGTYVEQLMFESV